MLGVRPSEENELEEVKIPPDRYEIILFLN